MKVLLLWDKINGCKIYICNIYCIIIKLIFNYCECSAKNRKTSWLSYVFIAKFYCNILQFVICYLWSKCVDVLLI